jgi:hypothetical protein
MGVGLGTERGIGLKTEMDAFNRSSMDRKADGILKSDSSSDIKIQGKEVRYEDTYQIMMVRMNVESLTDR